MFLSFDQSINSACLQKTPGLWGSRFTAIQVREYFLDFLVQTLFNAVDLMPCFSANNTPNVSPFGVKLALGCLCEALRRSTTCPVKPASQHDWFDYTSLQHT
jgi:hypothetical protein